MTYPILYKPNETNFDHNGLGILADCISCIVTEEANGSYELSMEYPSDGIHFDKITERSIIKAAVDDFRTPQLFEVYSTQKLISGKVKIYAQHISYRLSGIPVSVFSASTVFFAIEGLKNNAVIPCPFTFWTDKEDAGDFVVQVPSSIRYLIGATGKGILGKYGGELEFDNFSVKLHKNRGLDRGVSIRYGKNLTDLRQEQNCSSVFTGIYPYWASIDGTKFVELPEKIINSPGNYNFQKIKTVDFATNFEEEPTVEQLREAAVKYVEDEGVGVPTVSLTVSFLQLSKTEEYRNYPIFDRVSLFDTVSVEFPQMGVSAKAKVVKTQYDSLAKKLIQITLGKVQTNIADTIYSQQQELKNTATKETVKTTAGETTAWLTSEYGVKVERRDGLGRSEKMLILDRYGLIEAKNILVFGSNGIEVSNSGQYGELSSVIGIDGTVNPEKIKGGIIRVVDAETYNDILLINLINGSVSTISENGYLKLQNGSVDGYNTDGKNVFSIAIDADGDPVVSCPDLAADATGETTTQNKIAWKTIGGEKVLAAYTGG